MKKVLITYVAVAMALLVGINLVGAIDRDLTDEEIMNIHIHEEYGETYQGRLIESYREDWVCYHVYDENGDIVYREGLDRDYYQWKYTQE